MRYPIIIRRTSTGYSADIPDVPGCVATGKTVEHTRQMIAEALELHFEQLLESRQIAPPPSTIVETSDDADDEIHTWVEAETPQEFWAMIQQRRKEPAIPWEVVKQRLKEVDG